MAIKLNSNALVNQSIEEEKLASAVQTKLNKESIPDAPDSKDYVRNKGQWKEFEGVEEAPVDNSAYVRKNAGWEKYEYPPIEEPITLEITSAGENIMQVPPKCHYCEAFLVNSGNAGEQTNIHPAGGGKGRGGGGGNTNICMFSVEPLQNIVVNIANGVSTIPGDVALGNITNIIYNGVTYSPAAQNHSKDTNPGAKGSDGVLNQLNPNDTNLYGASGGGADDGYPGKGGTTGGGKGGGDDYPTSGHSGTFYGAGGGGGYNDKAGGSSYQGYAYLKFY